MPPKKAMTVEEGDELKQTLEFLAGEITTVKQQQISILALVEEVKVLRIQNDEKDRRVADLESRVAELEQYSRINDVIVTGLRIKPRSYARAVTSDNGGEPGEQDDRSAEQQVAAFLHTRGIEVDVNNVEACHPLSRRSDSNTPAVIMRFVNRKHKTELLKQGRKLKGTNVFINEHLTKRNADIARRARNLRKQGKIQNTWTNNCKVFIKLNGTPEQARVVVIRSMEELDRYQ